MLCNKGLSEVEKPCLLFVKLLNVSKFCPLTSVLFNGKSYSDFIPIFVINYMKYFKIILVLVCILKINV